MPNFQGKGAPSFASGLRGLPDMFASALRGLTTGTLGGPGDLEEVIRKISGNENENYLPTSEQVSGYLPQTGLDKSYNTYEKVGEFLPTSPAKTAPALVKAGLPGALSAALIPMRLDDPYAMRATALRAKGARPKDIWHETQLVEAEIPLAGKYDPPIWTAEILPENHNYLKPEARMSSEQKQRLIDTQLRLGNKDIQLQADNPEWGMIDQFVNTTEVPKPNRNIRFGDLTNHPAAQHIPELGDISTSIYQKGVAPEALNKYNETGYRGMLLGPQHTGKGNRIVLTGRDLRHIDDPSATPTSVLEHEFQHGIQNLYGLPEGGSVFDTPALQQLMQYRPSVLGQLARSSAKNEDVLRRQLRGVDVDPFQNYYNLAGERQARLAAERMQFTPKGRNDWRPQLFDDESEGAPIPLDRDFLYSILTQLEKNPGTTPSDLTSHILRHFGTR